MVWVSEMETETQEWISFPALGWLLNSSDEQQPTTQGFWFKGNCNPPDLLPTSLTETQGTLQLTCQDKNEASVLESYLCSSMCEQYSDARRVRMYWLRVIAEALPVWKCNLLPQNRRHCKRTRTIEPTVIMTFVWKQPPAVTVLALALRDRAVTHQCTGVKEKVSLRVFWEFKR